MTDVAVVGGGVTGLGVARDLALRDLDVTLFERSELVAGTSGRMHGLLHSGARYAVSDPASARECRRESQTLRDIAPHCVTDTGGLFVSLPTDPPHVERFVAACDAVGVPTRTLTGEAAREVEPHLSSSVERAVTVPDGVVDPVALCLATALDARRAGATIRTNAPVADLLLDGDRVTGVELAGGERVSADHVVNAAGPWADRVAAAAGVELDLTPSRGVMVVCDGPPVGRVLNRCRPRGEGDIVVPIDGRPVLGTTDRPVEDPEDYPRETGEIAAVRESLAAVVPALADAAVLEPYWGVRPLYDPGTDASDSGAVAARGFGVSTERGLTSAVGGKLTTYRLMAEAAADAVCADLGLDRPCQTADRSLPGAEDETALADAARRWAAESPIPGTPTGG